MIDIPNTNGWIPNESKSETFHKIIFERCKQIESEILNSSQHAKSFNINNFDSGVMVESIIKESISLMLPKRYKIGKGILCDRNGKTSGDHDIVIFNEAWFPYLTGNGANTKKEYFPIEGVYAVGEVKQTLNLENLDDGMRKLVLAQRLMRPRVGENRYTENRKSGPNEIGLSNPLFTFIIATAFNKAQFTIDEVFHRFFEINKTLPRQQMIKALCVLGEFYISWVILNESSGEFDVARFTSKDEAVTISPALRYGNEQNQSSFYDLVMSLGAHMNSSILGSEDIYVAYGNRNYEVKIPPIDYYKIQ